MSRKLHRRLFFDFSDRCSSPFFIVLQLGRLLFSLVLIIILPLLFLMRIGPKVEFLRLHKLLWCYACVFGRIFEKGVLFSFEELLELCF